MGSYIQLEQDIEEFIEHGGPHDRVLITIDNVDILATGIARHDGGFCLEFNNFHVRDFFKRRAFKKFFNENKLEIFRTAKVPECITPKAGIRPSAHEIVILLKEYFQQVHGLKDGYSFQIHKRVFTPYNK